MSEGPAAVAKAKGLGWALWVVALLGVAAVIYIIAQASIKPGAASGLKPLARGEMAKLSFPEEAGAAPVNTFLDSTGKPLRVADFRGKVLVLNLWATWCAPCVTEMPTLARLAKSFEGRNVVVVPVSVDSPSAQDKARAFIGQHAPLQYYADPQMKLPFALKPPAAGMPTTIIYGADGVERARLSGGADWSGADARAVVEQVLREP